MFRSTLPVYRLAGEKLPKREIIIERALLNTRPVFRGPPPWFAAGVTAYRKPRALPVDNKRKNGR